MWAPRWSVVMEPLGSQSWAGHSFVSILKKQNRNYNMGKEGLHAQRTCDSLNFPSILTMSFELLHYIQCFDWVKW